MHTASRRRSQIVLTLAGALTTVLLTSAVTPSAAAAVVVFRAPPHAVLYPRSAVWVGVAPPAIPPPRVAAVAPAPRPGWIWVPAYWRWTGARYVWVEGGWLEARPGFRFIAPHWEPTAGGWVFIAGAWRAA